MATGDQGPADTLPAEADVASDALPAALDQYELGERLGEGGMGVVYQARDRRLDRTVAIKLIRGGNPMLAMRLLREARAQARIDHPGVCRVYEVGEAGGRAYIALQFIAGEPLHKAAAQMSLDEKLAVVRDVAVAIHEAHRLGIVHRDLKPANIMIERGEDGRPQPIVMDFGLAREATVEVGLTESGALLGTPAYMSPEQARGDLRAIDRRSDVYSLGATLYELLTGAPPFTSTSLASALELILNQEPVPPRRVVASVPIDVETITLKCLQKDPAQRYASARALADDLTRYLDGETILGRRPTLRQRLRSRVRKHRALFVLGASSSLALLVVGALGIRSYLATREERARGADRARLAETLGRDAKDLELLLHTAYQLPLHDVRRERDAVRARMKTIAAAPHDLGPLGDAVVHDALGRGDLALHEWSAALAELDLAAKAGLDTPDLHAARGRALGELYHRAFEEARRSGDKTWLANREAELDKQYLQPALAELARARGAADSPLLDVLVAMYRRDYAGAKQRALAIADATPWVFEAKKLAADAVYAAAVADVDRGNYDAARPQLDEASTLYAQAADAARTDASVYEAAAQARFERAQIDDRQGKPSSNALDEAATLIDRAITADPDDATAYIAKAHVVETQAFAATADDAHRTLLDQQLTAAERAVSLDPTNAGAWDALGNAHETRGEWEADHGGNGEPLWTKARDELTHGLALRPNDPWTTNDLAVTHRWLATVRMKNGDDPMLELRAALDGYRGATRIDPAYVYAWSNQLDVSTMIARYQLHHGLDPEAAIEDAIRAGNQGLAVDPSFAFFLQNMASAELLRAEGRARTSDPSSALAAARDDLDRAEKLQPGTMAIGYYRARAARIEAGWLRAHGRDIASTIATARTALDEAQRIQPKANAIWTERAEVELVAGNLTAAATACDTAISLAPDAPDALLTAARVQLEIARQTHRRDAIERGVAYADKAFALDKSSQQARDVRTALLAL